MAYLTDYQYYENNGAIPEGENWGSYQYVKLSDIVRNFMLMKTGNHSLVKNEERYKVIFFAKRAIQELNYDALKEIKVLQLDLSDKLRFILPQDFVNFIRVSKYENGILYPMNKNVQAMSATSYLQDNHGRILFDEAGNILKPENSQIDLDRLTDEYKTLYLNDNSQFNGSYGYNYDGRWYFDYRFGGNYGMETDLANVNPVYELDRRLGVIHFSSDMAGKSAVLEYISDGMEGGDDSLISVNKLFEKYVYASIEHDILSSKEGIQEYIVRRKLKEKTALLRNARIRINDLSPQALLMPLRGRDKWIK